MLTTWPSTHESTLSTGRTWCRRLNVNRKMTDRAQSGFKGKLFCIFGSQQRDLSDVTAVKRNNIIHRICGFWSLALNMLNFADIFFLFQCHVEAVQYIGRPNGLTLDCKQRLINPLYIFVYIWCKTVHWHSGYVCLSYFFAVFGVQYRRQAGLAYKQLFYSLIIILKTEFSR